MAGPGDGRDDLMRRRRVAAGRRRCRVLTVGVASYRVRTLYRRACRPAPFADTGGLLYVVTRQFGGGESPAATGPEPRHGG